MSIRLINSRRRFRKYTAYDLEWIPGTLEVRLVGWYDGNRYHYSTSVESFLAHELTSKNSGRWYYAHAGGLADVQFIFEQVLKSREYSLTASFSGSSAIIVHIRRGKNVWHFVDSYWLLRDKLANIAKSMGMQKTGPTDDMSPEQVKEWYATVALPILIEYNENDCIVLWEAIRNFENALLEVGGQLQMTIAACAMHLFRRKYLSQEISTCDAVNKISRGSYFASRVEVFESGCESGYYYDINSSFPFAMTQAVPGDLLDCHSRIPDRLLYGDTNLFMADVTVTIPESYLPPLPTRIDGRVFFPFGRWRSWLCGIDIQLLLREGGRIERVHDVYEFESVTYLADYARDIYERRKATDDTFVRLVYKYLLNSLYGKFAESKEKRTIHIRPDKKILERLDIYDKLMPGVWQENIVARVPHMHVPISSYITARARKSLYDFLVTCTDYHYCDTDGFSTTQEFPVNTELGGLKLEKTINNASYYAPKVYRIDGQVFTKGKWKTETLVKAKGFSLGSGNKAVQKFEQLVSGAEIEVERMIRLRENFNRGVVTPTEIKVIKRFKQSLIPKRHTYPDGSTRPWHIKELV